jgi:hypothetical protein
LQFTQEKIISVPLGVPGHLETFRGMKNAIHTNMKYYIIVVVDVVRLYDDDACCTDRKEALLLTAGSNYFFRPSIRECVKDRLGDALYEAPKTTQEQYLYNMPKHYMVLSPSGLGADTYRLWEGVALG